MAAAAAALSEGRGVARADGACDGGGGLGVSLGEVGRAAVPLLATDDATEPPAADDIFGATAEAR